MAGSPEGRHDEGTPAWGDEPTLLGDPVPSSSRPGGEPIASDSLERDSVEAGRPSRASSRAVVLGVMALIMLPLVLVVSLLTGSGQPAPASAARQTATAPASGAPASPPARPTITTPTPITLPSVVGRNGAIIQADLKALGIGKITFRSTGEFGAPVLLVQNWTGVSIEPAAGTIVTPDETVVVTVRRAA